jgi:cold shock CspA family protein
VTAVLSFATSRPLSPDTPLMPRPKSIGPSKPVHAGTPAKGRIKLLIRGQGCGIISASRGDVFFHKTEVQGKFWDLKVGDRVVFELLDDSISGPRAQHVQAARSRKAR